MKTLALLQGLYFAITGVWPLVHLRSFEAVTGRKTDKWLVKTVGVLITVISAAMLTAALRENITPEIILLAVSSAAVLAAVDFWYALRGVIPKIYLTDGLAELALIACWIVLLLYR